MHIVIACATLRGLTVLERLSDLAPNATISVFSFPEEPHEPPFLAAIEAFCASRNHAICVTRKIHGSDSADFWLNNPVDLMFSVAWRYMIPAEIFLKPRFGTFVFHDSLLPRYRGFAPTPWAIINGETSTGATLFEISEQMDEGPVVGQCEVPIGPDDTIADVMSGVTKAYVELLERHLPDLAEGKAVRMAQDESQATYTCKRLPDDARIDWSAATASIYNLVRGSTRPYAGARTMLDGKPLTIWSARPLEGRDYVGRVPGRVVQVIPSQGVAVLTGDGVLLVEEVQLENTPPQAASEVLNRLSATLR